LQELLYLGPEERLRRLFSSICVHNQNRADSATFGNSNRVMNEENAQNKTANQKKALRVGIILGWKHNNLNTFRVASE
jgi:hypothetical protein